MKRTPLTRKAPLHRGDAGLSRRTPLGIRETWGLITDDTSSFVPHRIDLLEGGR